MKFTRTAISEGIWCPGLETTSAGKGGVFHFRRKSDKNVREEHPGSIEQDLPPFVIAGESGPAGPIRDGTGNLLQFPGRSAIEICRAFEMTFHPVRTGTLSARGRRGMMEYDTEHNIPRHYLVEPPHIEHNVCDYLALHHLRRWQ